MEEESDGMFLRKFCGRLRLPYSDEEKQHIIMLRRQGVSMKRIAFSLRFISYIGNQLNGIAYYKSLLHLKEWRDLNPQKFRKSNRNAMLRHQTCKIVRTLHPETRKIYARMIREMRMNESEMKEKH